MATQEATEAPREDAPAEPPQEDALAAPEAEDRFGIVPEGAIEDPPLDETFDLEWPVEFDDESFFVELTEIIARKGYCSVHMPMSSEDRARAEAQLGEQVEWKLEKMEFDVAYMGERNVTKYCMLAGEFEDPLPSIAEDEDIENLPQAEKLTTHAICPECGRAWRLPEPLDGVCPECGVPIYEFAEDILDRCNDKLTVIASMFQETVHSRLGFSAWSRTNGMLRRTFEKDDEEEILRPLSLGEFDYEDGIVFGFLQFLERRKLLMLWDINNEGGKLILSADEDRTEHKDVMMPLSGGRLVIFRHDLMNYTYRPGGTNSILLQSWILAEPWYPVSSPADGTVVELPEPLQGERVQVMACNTLYAGKVRTRAESWLSLMGGIDSFVKVPTSRFNIDAVYSEHAQSTGGSYTIHGAYIDDNDAFMFDNSIFGITTKEASNMSPGQRLILERGLMTLCEGGYDKTSCRGQDVGVFLGDSHSDWKEIAANEVSAAVYMGMSTAVTCSRLSHVLGLKGPCASTDTACSSALVAVFNAFQTLKTPKPEWKEEMEYSTKGRCPMNSTCKSALAMAYHLVLSAGLYTGYSGAGMLSKKGRCFTFDHTSDGFGRGEGVSSVLLRVAGEDKSEGPRAEEMLACLAGCAVNQDGRSATMTAPNGPSQQTVIRESLECADIDAAEIAVAECHGTGTALGDPIEVGALRFVMKGTRYDPILCTSYKSNGGHQEPGAGLAGLVKCINMVVTSTTPSNQHLKAMNPHLDTGGFPCFFATEADDYGTNIGCIGVSSFGSGGTNGRGDVWGRCLMGDRRTTGIVDLERVDGSMARLQERVGKNGTPGPSIEDQLFLIGSWDAWSSMTQMRRVGEEEAMGIYEYTGTIIIGDTCREQFQLCLNEDFLQAIHPAHNLSDERGHIVGPDTDGHSKNWLVDGRKDNVTAGSKYIVRFRWSFSWERGEFKKVTWTLSDAVEKPPNFRHIYSVVSSWSSWQFLDMKKAENEDCLYIRARIGPSGQEEFQIVRDHDWSQVIHPASELASRTSIPIRGPDNKGKGKNWVIRGPSSEVVTISLRVQRSEITVWVQSKSKGTKTWRTPGKDTHDFFYVGDSTSWGMTYMYPDRKKKGVKGVHRYALVATAENEEFKIVMDGDWEKALYPEVERAGMGQRARGPDGRGHGLNWMIPSRRGEAYEIIFVSHATDPAKKVFWRRVEEEDQQLTLTDQAALDDQETSEGEKNVENE